MVIDDQAYDCRYASTPKNFWVRRLFDVLAVAIDLNSEKALKPGVENFQMNHVKYSKQQFKMAEHAKAFDLIAKIFGINSLKEYQKESLIALSQNKDCFICQPTGSGKSLVFQALPFFIYTKKKLSNTTINGNEYEKITASSVLANCNLKILVVSPLFSLIQDQENKLSKKKIRVSSITTAGSNALEHVEEVSKNRVETTAS